jgi:nucleoside triphosphate diphosphatase
LRRNGLIDFEVCHLQLAQQIQQEGIFFRRQVAAGLLVQGIEHVDQLARRLRVDHRLTGARIGISAQHHRGIAAQHAHKILEGQRTLWRVDGRLRGYRCSVGCGRKWGGRLSRGLALGFALRFAFFLLDNFLAKIAFRRKWPAIDDPERRFFLFLIGMLLFGQVTILLSHVLSQFSIALHLWVAQALEHRGMASFCGFLQEFEAGFATLNLFDGRYMASRKRLPKNTKKRRTIFRKRSGPKQLSAGDWFEKLVGIQKRLRDPGGCAWDREQTHQSLRTYLIEEAYEVLDALESGDDEKFTEELGDLLLQVTFHSQIASEAGRFSVSDVIRTVHEKMIRRHPHVFGEQRAIDSAEVLKNWQKIKAKERQTKDPASPSEGQRGSALDGVPRAIPAALEALQLTKKAARTGFDWDDAIGVLEKMREETAEVQHASQSGDHSKVEEELGDLLFATVNLARFLHVDPEIALKSANAKFVRRFHAMERLAGDSGRKFDDVPRSEKEELWSSVKLSEQKLVRAAPASQPVSSRKAGHRE